MKKVGICGHFGLGLDLLNGQSIKTKIVTDELKKQLGENQVAIVDSHGGAKAFPRMAIQLIKLFSGCENVIMMPAHKGVRIFTILFSFYNIFFHRKLHYVVIGGWIDNFMDKYRWLKKLLMKYDSIFVETTTMKKALEKRGFKNIYIMPNFKELKILSESEIICNYEKPYKLCTFSRVMKQKGIEDAINAVKSINEEKGEAVYELDIYGQIFQYDEFEQIKSDFPDYIHYKGCVPYNESVHVLKNYFALLFPTKFYTEGIPGTIIDAYAAGVPVISSKWESFSDVIEDGVTGLGYEFDNVDGLKNTLKNISENPLEIINKKKNCIKKAVDYLPENAIGILIKTINK